MSVRRSVILLADDSTSQVVLAPVDFTSFLQLLERLFSIPATRLQLTHPRRGTVNSKEAYAQLLASEESVTIRVTVGSHKVSRSVEYSEAVVGFESMHKVRLLRLNDDSVSFVDSPLLDWMGRVCLLGPDALLFTGGGQRPRCALLFTVTAETHTVLAEMNSERVWHGLCALGAQAFAVGGKDPSTGVALSLCESLKDGQWTALPKLNFPRESLSVTTHRGNVLAVGGFDGLHRLQSIETLRPAKWLMLPVRLPEARQLPGLVFMEDERLMIVGGHAENRAKNTVFTLNLDTGKTEKLSPLPHGDYFAGKQLAKKPSGEICGFGKHTYVYFPAQRMWASSAELTRFP